jgi:hypothetical protein
VRRLQPWLALAPAVLLLSGCGDDGPAADGNVSAAEAAEAANLMAGLPTGTLTPEQIRARIQSALRPMVIEPETARLAHVRAGAAGSVCGEVDSKQPGGARGGFRPFVITPDGVAVISPAPRVMFDDPADLFPDFYMRWCASPQELATLPTQIANTAAPAVPDVPVDPAAIPDPLLNETVAAPPLPSAPPPAAAVPPAKADSDDFLRSVVRPAPPQKK